MRRGEIWTGTFWRATAERAASTAAQAALLVLGADLIDEGINVATIEWETVGGFALGGAVLTVLKCVASARMTGGGPSLTNAEALDPSDPPP